MYVHRTVAAGTGGAGEGIVSFFAHAASRDRFHVLCTFRSLKSWFLQGFVCLYGNSFWNLQQPCFAPKSR